MASVGPKLAIEKAWVSSPIAAVPASSATIAVISGNVIASSEPNAAKSTIAAPTMPMISLVLVAGLFRLLTTSPPTSTCTLGVRAAWAVSTTRSTSPSGRCPPPPEKATVAKPVEPSGEICAAPLSS